MTRTEETARAVASAVRRSADSLDLVEGRDGLVLGGDDKLVSFQVEDADGRVFRVSVSELDSE